MFYKQLFSQYSDSRNYLETFAAVRYSMFSVTFCEHSSNHCSSTWNFVQSISRRQLQLPAMRTRIADINGVIHTCLYKYANGLNFLRKFSDFSETKKKANKFVTCLIRLLLQFEAVVSEGRISRLTVQVVCPLFRQRHYTKHTKTYNIIVTLHICMILENSSMPDIVFLAMKRMGKAPWLQWRKGRKERIGRKKKKL